MVLTNLLGPYYVYASSIMLLEIQSEQIRQKSLLLGNRGILVGRFDKYKYHVYTTQKFIYMYILVGRKLINNIESMLVVNSKMIIIKQKKRI